MPDLALGPGDIVAGKYQIETLLGTGGMGYVVRARHLALGERVAIKVLNPDSARDEEAVRRFSREAKAVSRIKGDHVVKLLDVGALEDNTPFIVMEYLDGCDLSSLVEQKGVLPVSVTIDYVLQACEALAEAHAIGIVHRDVKPSNLFLTTRVDGSACIKILDFGISKMVPHASQAEVALTHTQSVFGSPQYMAPEQMRSSKHVDPRTDIWSVGTIIHELLTGNAPFSAETMPELFAMILQDPTPSLCAVRSDVPPELDLVVRRCLEKNPDDRYPSIDALARALAPFAGAGSKEHVERIERVAHNAKLRATPTPNDRASTSASFVAAQTIPRTRGASTAQRMLLVGSGVLFLAGVAFIVLALRKPSKTGAAEMPSPGSSASVVVGTMPTLASGSDPPTATMPTASATVEAPKPPTSASGRRVPPAKAAPKASAAAVPANAAPLPSATPATTASSRYD